VVQPSTAGWPERLVRMVTLPADVERVWAALTLPGELARWFGAEVDLEARPGARGEFRWPDGRVRGAVVEVALPPRTLRFRWLPFERVGDDILPCRSSTVEMTLEPDGDRTRLTVTEWLPIRQEEPPRGPRPPMTFDGAAGMAGATGRAPR
jgi:uncharacterized protein YndB with AHSA1/START domain